MGARIGTLDRLQELGMRAKLSGDGPRIDLGSILKAAAGLAVSAIFVVFLVRKIPLKDALEGISRSKPEFIILAIFSLLGGYGLRILRWKIMLGAYNSEIRFVGCIAPYMGSIAMNNLLPFRIGDLVRALVFPGSLGISRTDSTIALVLERILDVVALVLLLLWGIVLFGKGIFPGSVLIGATALGAIAIPATVLLFAFSSRLGAALEGRAIRPGANPSFAKLEGWLAKVLMSASRILTSRYAGPLSLTTLGLWLLEAGLYACLVIGFGWQKLEVHATSIMAVGTLSTLIPSSPGYIGTFHFAVYTFLSYLGVPAAEAASYAILSHLTVWVPTSIIGIVAIALKPAMFSTKRPLGKGAAGV